MTNGRLFSNYPITIARNFQCDNDTDVYMNWSITYFVGEQNVDVKTYKLGLKRLKGIN